MRLLLDTQLVFWWQTGDRKIPAEARILVEQSIEPVLVSRVSLWELAIKAGVGKLKIDLAMFAKQVGIIGFSWLSIENEHVLQVAALPLFDDHKDPFDRLLVAQSLSEPLILLTVDAKLARYGNTVRVV
ncbi:MAG TPA: type II toxin-antitoxin system VapC family toxin [Candidatus Competibacter sp.]|nr:type II toxin-antitoxin system VapC family toxin [Candidatus Competibacter sp.]